MTESASQTSWLRRSHHSSVETARQNRISEPPIVGVPAFFLWVAGPSSRIVSPIWRDLSRSMNHGPIRNESSSAVIAAARMRVDG